MIMKKLFTLLAALLCATATWAEDYTVGTDSELRSAIQNDGANIIVTADINLSNSTLSIAENKTVTIDLRGHTLDRKLTSRGSGGGQVITLRSGATLNLINGTLKGGWGGNSTDPYLMKSTNEWKALAKQVAEGKNFQNQFFRLSADIDTKGIQTPDY